MRLSIDWKNTAGLTAVLAFGWAFLRWPFVTLAVAATRHLGRAAFKEEFAIGVATAATIKHLEETSNDAEARLNTLELAMNDLADVPALRLLVERTEHAVDVHAENADRNFAVLTKSVEQLTLMVGELRGRFKPYTPEHDDPSR